MLQPGTEQHHFLYHLQQNLKNPSYGILSAAGIDWFMQVTIAIQQQTFQKPADHFKALCTPVQFAYAEDSLFDENKIPVEDLVQDIGPLVIKNSNLWHSYNTGL
eukprot:1558472-Ditylum_brightwellii.AAC.1